MDRNYQVGDIVAIRPEWRDERENPDDRYLVLEVYGPDKVRVEYIETSKKPTLGSTYCYSTDWIYFTGYNINTNKED